MNEIAGLAILVVLIAEFGMLAGGGRRRSELAPLLCHRCGAIL